MDYSTIAQSLLAGMTGNNQNMVTQPKRSVITVAGLNEARGFNLNPGESIVLIDANDDFFYIKECDEIGKSTTKSFKYEEVQLEETPVGSVSKKEFDKDKEILVAQLAASQVAQTTQLENYIDTKLAAAPAA